MSRVFASMLLCCSVVAQIDTFSFAGLSLRATMEELRVKYPRSTAIGGLIYLSDQDSYEDISTIGLSGSGSARTLTIHFERERNGTAAYPPARTCSPMWNGDTAGPAETLTLSCFRMLRQPLYAERITIAVNP